MEMKTTMARLFLTLVRWRNRRRAKKKGHIARASPSFFATTLLLAVMPAYSTSHAITLDKLVAGGTLDVNGLVFSKFEYQANGPDMAKADKIEVSGILLNGQPGIQFDGSWSGPSTATGLVETARIAYMVMAKGKALANGARLLANFTVTPTTERTDGFIQARQSLLVDCTT
jgi:hypothetical protein